MSHFASVDWPNPYGPVARVEREGVAMLTATASTSTEGTDKLTYTVARTGTYRVAGTIRIATASGAGTSHTVAPQVAYNNGAAISAADIGGAFTDIDAKVANTVVCRTETIRAVAGTTITLTILHTVSGTGSGTYDISLLIEAI